jgi:hypothetical protein
MKIFIFQKEILFLLPQIKEQIAANSREHQTAKNDILSLLAFPGHTG